MNPAEQKLTELRKALRGKVREDGIYLVASFRYKHSAKGVAEAIRQLGGEAEVCKVGKTEYQDHQASRSWRVQFTVGLDEDQYLAGRVSMRAFREMQRFSLKGSANPT